MIPPRLLHRLFAASNAEQWRVSEDDFARALERSLARAFPASSPSEAEVARHCESLHLVDLALACACANGDSAAWDHFVLTYRPHLYRAAASLDPSGGARDLADELYGELFGLKRGDPDAPQSLFRYFHGRSSLATWLRSVLAQRHIDRVRASRRHEPLPDDDAPGALPAPASTDAPERSRFVRLMQAALAAALALLAATDRLRLRCYYAQRMTLAQIGRLLGEHEATVSRQLAKTRQALRASIVAHLKSAGGLDDTGVDACFAAVVDDTGPLDLDVLFRDPSGGLDPSADQARKNSAADRSPEGQSL